MRIRRAAAISSSLTVLVLAGAVAGCSSPGYKTAEAKVESLGAVRTELDQGKKQIGVVVAALEQVVTTGSTDPRPAYDKFVAELANLESTAANVKSRAESLQVQGKEYFQAWQTQLEGVQSAELRASSAQRQAQAKERFEKVRANSQIAKASYQPFMSNLGDIKKVLAVDLNASGIASIAPVVARTKETAQGVVTAVDNVIVEIDAVAAAIAPKAAPVPPPTAEGQNK